MSDKRWDALNELDQILRRAAPAGMTDGELLILRGRRRGAELLGELARLLCLRLRTRPRSIDTGEVGIRDGEHLGSAPDY